MEKKPETIQTTAPPANPANKMIRKELNVAAGTARILLPPDVYHY